jgi:large subunit ribosomal protein L30
VIPTKRSAQNAPRFRGHGRRGAQVNATMPKDGEPTMAKLKVTQIKSGIGHNQSQRDTLRSLGLKRMHDTVVKEDRPEIRGMVHTVRHLVSVEEVD